MFWNTKEIHRRDPIAAANSLSSRRRQSLIQQVKVTEKAIQPDEWVEDREQGFLLSDPPRGVELVSWVIGVKVEFLSAPLEGPNDIS